MTFCLLSTIYMALQFSSDGIQSGELERRFVTGARAIEHFDFQSRAFR